MLKAIRNFIVVGAVCFLIASSLLIKIFSPRAVENLYHSGKVDILNEWTDARGAQSLDFYAGRMEEVLFGPLSMVFSGLAFLLFSLKFLQGVKKIWFFAAVFLYLIFIKFEILFSPPYGDSASGPWMEAVWLCPWTSSSELPSTRTSPTV